MPLSRKNRLKEKKDFDRVFKNGKTIKGRFLLVKYTNMIAKTPKFGFVVSAKIAKRAVDRNRVKRLLSNNVQKNLGRMTKDAVILVLRLPSKESEKTLISQETADLIQKLYD